ncbi:hypothetical protein Nepgr_004008 [Nepenthes gracilis]|uniref:Uncharacterized protein n=1 Tax=Nepenthes gracilis TaxID=150966 RepID=A0AAD3S0P6_NEPGR|nr:hypothetical protein Nepgr_004008 [Nepenthes gracilis]
MLKPNKSSHEMGRILQPPEQAQDREHHQKHNIHCSNRGSSSKMPSAEYHSSTTTPRVQEMLRQQQLLNLQLQHHYKRLSYKQQSRLLQNPSATEQQRRSEQQQNTGHESAPTPTRYASRFNSATTNETGSIYQATAVQETASQKGYKQKGLLHHRRPFFNNQDLTAAFNNR